MQIVLYRHDVEGPWALHVNVEDHPAAESVNALVDEVVAAARGTGLAVTGVNWRDRAGGGSQ